MPHASESYGRPSVTGAALRIGMAVAIDSARGGRGAPQLGGRTDREHLGPDTPTRAAAVSPGIRTARRARRCRPPLVRGSLRSPLTPRRSLRSRLASLATDHSGHAGALRTARARSGLKCMCPRASASPVSVPDFRRLPGLNDPRRTWLRRGRNGECAGRSLRAGRRKTHFVRLPSPASLRSAGRRARLALWPARRRAPLAP